VKVNGDSDPEPNETFKVLLSNAVGAFIKDGEGVGTIKSDDYQPKISISDSSKIEAGTTMKFVLTLDAPTGKQVKVTYQTFDGTAIAPGDYTAKGPNVVSFSAGATRRTISVQIKHDTTSEGDEQYTVVLTNPVNGSIVDGEAIGTIIDND
jgi:hypothetical protein